MRVIVVYATKRGSTAEVADAIASGLRAQGCDAEVREAGGLRELPPCEGIVLGAPIYSGNWHAHARRFLKRFRRELPNVPTAVFALGPRRDEPEAWERVGGQFERILEKYPWVMPVSTAVFGGVDPPGKRASRDLRDWDAIGEWAQGLSARFASQEVPAPLRGPSA